MCRATRRDLDTPSRVCAIAQLGIQLLLTEVRDTRAATVDENLHEKTADDLSCRIM